MPSALPNICRVDFQDTEKVISTIERDGGVILTNFTSPAVVEKVNSEVQTFLDTDKPWKVSYLACSPQLQSNTFHSLGQALPT